MMCMPSFPSFLGMITHALKRCKASELMYVSLHRFKAKGNEQTDMLLEDWRISLSKQNG